MSASVDERAAEQAVADFLTAMGHDPTSERLRATPKRVVQAFHELTHRTPPRITTFPNTHGYDEPLSVRGITFVSVCEHHLLPFRGVAHVGYLPTEHVVGLSALAHVVRECAKGLQLQEQLTVDIADTLAEALEAPAIGVVLEAEHDCMAVRGVKAEGAMTVTSAFRGPNAADPVLRAVLLTGATDTTRSLS